MDYKLLNNQLLQNISYKYEDEGLTLEEREVLFRNRANLLKSSIHATPESRIVHKRKSNAVKGSYQFRLLRSKKRILNYRTIQQKFMKRVPRRLIEQAYLKYIGDHIKKIEKREKYKKSLNGFAYNYVSMRYRFFSFTKVFVTNKVGNTFVTISRGKQRENGHSSMHVLAKVSCGLIGYKGPKKSTVFARKAVIKDAGSILAGKLTSLLDVIFTTRIARWSRKTVRDLCPGLSYILNIEATYNRTHGKRKYKNKQRK
jgi:hypothetical protein